VLDRDALVLLDDDLAGLGGDVETGDLALQPLRNDFELDSLLAEVERVEDEELRENALGRVPEGLEKDRDRHLAATVDAEV